MNIKPFSVFLLLGILSLWGCQPATSTDDSGVEVTNNHTADVVFSWGTKSSGTASTATAPAGFTLEGSQSLGAGKSVSITPKTGVPRYLWYKEGSGFHILFADGQPRAFTFLKTKAYQITLNATYTYTFKNGKETLTPTAGDDAAGKVYEPPYALSAPVINVSTDAGAALFTIKKATLAYSPSTDSVRLFVRMTNTGTVAARPAYNTVTVTLKDAAGTTLFAKVDSMHPASLSPYYHSGSTSVFYFIAEPQGDFILHNYGSLTTLASYSLTPAQIASVEISFTAPTTSATFVPVAKRVTITGTPSITATGVNFALINPSGLNYSLTGSSLLGLDAQGRYVDAEYLSSSPILMANSTLALTAFGTAKSLPVITSVELVPAYSTDSGLALTVLPRVVGHLDQSEVDNSLSLQDQKEAGTK